MFKLKNILTVGCLALLLAIAAFSISLWQTPKYKSSSKLLVVFSQDNVDTYTASKTSNYITGILGEVVYSDSFINSVFKSETNLVDNLGNGSEIRQKNWNKIIKVKILENKGILMVDAYGDSKYQTNLLASAISYTLINQHGIYDGSNDRVSLKMIDTPSIYENWSTAKIIRDALIGFLAGLFLGLTFVVIFPNHKLFELSTKEKYHYLTAPKPIQPYQPEKKEPASANPSVSQNQISNQPAYSQAKTNNPWLEKYYEENFPEKLN